jgi:hypothetical protein
VRTPGEATAQRVEAKRAMLILTVENLNEETMHRMPGECEKGIQFS